MIKSNNAFNPKWDPSCNIPLKGDRTNFTSLAALYSLDLAFGISGTTPNILSFLDAINESENLGLSMDDFQDIVMNIVATSFQQHSFHTIAETFAGFLVFKAQRSNSGKVRLSDKEFMAQLVEALKRVAHCDESKFLVEELEKLTKTSHYAPA